MDKRYSYMVRRASELLSTYPSRNINGKDAEDFVMDVLAEDGRLSWHAVKCNIIDAARSKWGRPERGGPVRYYERHESLGRITVNDGDTEAIKAEEIDDIVSRLPGLPDTYVTVVRGLAAGMEQKAIAIQLGVTNAAVGKIIDRLVVRLAADSEWNGIMSRYVSRFGCRNNRSNSLAS